MTEPRWAPKPRNVARAAALVSAGSLTLVVMATVVVASGPRSARDGVLFFRSAIGLLFVLPCSPQSARAVSPKRPAMHLLRGAVGAVGNACFFWTITHMLLADAMALQFSRPLFMIPLAVLLLGETVGLRRTAVAVVGFAGIALYARPFTGGFEPAAFVGALGALAGGLVVICIKRLATTEPTRVIMFYYAFWNTVFALIPAALFWVTPTLPQLGLLAYRLSRHWRTEPDHARAHHGRSDRAGAARLLAHYLFGRARLPAVQRDPGPLELCRHGADRGLLALPRAYRETAQGGVSC
jgi:drug/metabolite transporter (DMT)-like permease